MSSGRNVQNPPESAYAALSQAAGGGALRPAADLHESQSIPSQYARRPQPRDVAVRFTSDAAADSIVRWLNRGAKHCVAWHDGATIFVGTFKCTFGDWIVRDDSSFKLRVLTHEQFCSEYAFVAPDTRPRASSAFEAAAAATAAGQAAVNRSRLDLFVIVGDSGQMVTYSAASGHRPRGATSDPSAAYAWVDQVAANVYLDAHGQALSAELQSSVLCVSTIRDLPVKLAELRQTKARLGEAS